MVYRGRITSHKAINRKETAPDAHADAREARRVSPSHSNGLEVPDSGMAGRGSDLERDWQACSRV